MRWLKRNSLNGIAIGMLLFLVLIPWVLIQVEKPQPAHAATGGTVQGTPTVDTTAVVQDQLKQQDEKLQRDNSFPWILLNAVGGSLGTILVAAAALLAAWLGWRQWFTNRKDEQKKREEEQKQRREDQLSEQKKRAEERFQKVVEGFGGDNEGAKVGAAILLRTFLHPGYEQFYTQTFGLAVANLRLPRTTDSPKDPAAPLPPTALSQALIMAFIEAFPLAREHEKKNVGAKLASLEHKVRSTHPTPVTIPSTEIRSLNANLIQLDNGFLWYADLKQAWMPQASLRKADLTGADLSGANLWSAYLSEAYLWSTNLSGANLWQADLSKADFRGTDLSRATLLEANLSEARLYYDVDLRGADLSRADLSRADLSEVKNFEDVLSLKKTILRGVKGLTKEQLEACKAKGAIIDEESTTSSPSSLSPGNDVQSPLAPSTQRDIPIPDAGSSAASPEQGTEP